jgi:glutamyl-tRNA reductase
LADENTQPLLESISKGLINKILHEPTIQLKNTEELEHLYSQAHLLERLFNLENSIKSDKSDLKNNFGSQQA